MKRVISIFLTSVMIISAVLCVDLSALATDVEVSNRAEWLSKLTQVFDMTVEEDNYPDNYFSDMSSESPYYRDIMVAAEFGLIDIEAGDPVNPDGDITREFAAQTLNFCVGWELEKGDDFSYSFADYESCAYPDDDQIAVDHNWIALDDGNFMPEQKVTAQEINTMIADAQETLEGDEIDENYDSTVEFSDDVIEVPENVSVDFGDGEVVIHSTAYSIKKDDTFVVYSNGIPVTYTAVEVTNNGDSLTIKTSDDVDENAVEDVDIQTVIDVDASDFIPAEGYEVVEEHASYASAKGAKRKSNTSIEVKLSKDLEDGKKIEFTLKLSNIQLSFKQNSETKSFTAKTSFDLELGFAGELGLFNIDDILGDDFGLIRIGGIGFFQVKPDIKINGKIKLNQKFNIVGGFTKDSNGLHNISSFKKDCFSFTFEASGKIGIKIEVGVKGVAIKTGIYLTVGVTGKFADQANSINGNYLHCITLSAYLYLNIGAELKISMIVWKVEEKVEWKVFKETNSPLRLYFHWENGERVDECTAGKSAFVSPSGTNYGSISNTNAYTGSNAELNYSISGGEVKITGYKGSPTRVVIPSKINGYPVTSIGDGAFEYCLNLTSITIPNSVTSIGNHAFEGCTSLTSITIPNSVTSIGYCAFYNCPSLTSIVVDSNNKYYDSRNNCNAIIETSTNTLITGCKNTVIPNSVTSIGDGAFASCPSLTSITIPNSVTSIGYWAFGDCTSVTSIVVDSSNQYYDSRNNCNAIIETSTNTLIAGCKNTVIPNSVTSIGERAFEYCKSLTSITIPNSVTSIGYEAFEWCESLTSITIPNSVKHIEYYAFGGCSSITSIVVDSNNKYYDSRNNCNAIIETSTNELITGCKNTVIPNSVTSIGRGAFGGCKSLTSITIPNSVTSIGEDAFFGCTSLTDVYYTGTKEQWNAISLGSYDSDLKNATIHYPPHEHSYNSIVTPPTCTEQGHTTHTCECGDSYVDTYVDALGHKSDKGTVTKKATYTATGVKTYKCVRCGKVLKTETIAKLPKKANTLVAKGRTATVKFANLKKKNQVVAQKNAFAISKAQGKVTYKKASGNKSITVNSAGKITVKKGLKKGTYKVAVNVTAAGNATYKAKTVKVIVVVKVN